VLGEKRGGTRSEGRDGSERASRKRADASRRLLAQRGKLHFARVHPRAPARSLVRPAVQRRFPLRFRRANSKILGIIFSRSYTCPMYFLCAARTYVPDPDGTYAPGTYTRIRAHGRARTCHGGKYTAYIRVACRRWLVHRSTCWKRLGLYWRGWSGRREGQEERRESTDTRTLTPTPTYTHALSLSLSLSLVERAVPFSLHLAARSRVAKASSHVSRRFHAP